MGGRTKGDRSRASSPDHSDISVQGSSPAVMKRFSLPEDRPFAVSEGIFAVVETV
jgi:hypothetical protein